MKTKAYYKLTKPGIVYGNVMHAVAAALFAVAMTHNYAWDKVIWMLIGLGLIVASACVTNCIMDRELDAKMDRTKRRPLPLKHISVRNAATYSTLLLIAGAAVLFIFVNIVALICALVGHLTYTAVYGYAKRHTWTSTMIGTVPGAMPILVGYAAVAPELSTGAWILWVVVLLWQLPHFYALSLFRKDDYAKSGLPLLSVVKPRSVVVQHMGWTSVLYVASTILLVFYSGLPITATIIMAIGALYWAYIILFAENQGTDGWAKKVFGVSIYLSMVMIVASVVAVAATVALA